MEHILDREREAGFHEAVAWSDVRLETAHQVYDRLGFARIGERDIDDIDQSHELGFLKRLTDAGPAGGMVDPSPLGA